MDYGKIIDIIEIEKEKWEGLIIVTSKLILTIGISSNLMEYEDFGVFLCYSDVDKSFCGKYIESNDRDMLIGNTINNIRISDQPFEISKEIYENGLKVTKNTKKVYLNLDCDYINMQINIYNDSNCNIFTTNHLVKIWTSSFDYCLDKVIYRNMFNKKRERNENK